VPGEAPRGFVCPGKECGEAFPTAAEAWAHAAEQHGIKEDKCRCLYDGCGRVFGKAEHYRNHEPMHTGDWPFACPTCAKGYSIKQRAEYCCMVVECKCGKKWKGENREKSFAKHAQKCKQGRVD